MMDCSDDKTLITKLSDINIDEMDVTRIDFSTIIGNDEKIITSRIIKLSSQFSDLPSFKMVDFYDYRAKLVARKLKVARILAALKRSLAKIRKEVYDEYKTPPARGKYNTNQILLNNAEEREIYIGYNIRIAQSLVDNISNWLNFIMDSIKTLDQMIFGIDHIIKIHDKFGAFSK